MRRAALFLFSSAILALTGCYASARVPAEPEAPTPETPVPEVPTDPTVPAPAVDDLACDPGALALAWSARDGDAFAGVYHPVALDVAPGGALFVRSGYFRGEVARMADGSPVVGLDGTRLALDASWTRSLETDHETHVTTVRDIATGDVLLTVEAPSIVEGWFEDGWSVARTGALSPDGTTAILLECAQSRPSPSEETRTTVRAITIATGAERSAVIDLACGEAWHNPSRILPIADGAVIISGLRAPGPSFVGDAPAPVLGIARFDLATGAVITAFPSDETRPPIIGSAHVGEPGGSIISVAVSEDGAELAVVARDGMLRRLDPATLAPIADPIAVPLFVANHDTYMPSIESPVAYSLGHTLIAHLGSEGEIVIRDTRTGDVRASLALPFVPREDGQIAPAMAMQFLDDGILVTTSRGMARFGCGGAIADVVRPSGELAVSVAGPSRVLEGELTRYEVTALHASLPVARSVRMGPTGYVAGSLGSTVTAHSYESGAMDVEVVIDDGVRTARTTMRIDVVATD